MPVVASTAYSSARAITALVRSLLNDSANLLSVPVAIVSISRNAATGVVQVVTALPHNMVPGDNCLVSGVPTGTSNFNGTFPVQAISGPLVFSYAQAGVADIQLSGNVQGYGIGAKYTDSVLMPFVNANYQMLGNELENMSSQQYIRDNVLLTVPAVATPDSSVQVVINDATAPPNQLPADLVAPLKIWERPASVGSADFFEMVNLTDGGGIPPTLQGQTLEVWEWRTDGLVFRGATQDTQIRLRYLAGFADLVDGTSSTLLRAMREAVAYPTAIDAAHSRGGSVPDWYATKAQMALDQVLQRGARQMQHRNFRARPFSRRKGYTPF